jgi:lipopolysaccharide/colanic/teichoic acid biosynthesis glycosyltransferase
MIAKRFFDITMSLIMIVLFSPIMLGVAVFVRLVMGGPAIFRQPRPGRNERTFTLFKFRTMKNETGSDGELLSDTERLTPAGSFLRKCSLDELPQLWNVLKGDMSFVGPRPLLLRYTPYFTERERLRLTVRPGITGWAQINGRNTLNWDARLACDVWYVENWSLMLDLKILIKTVGRVFGSSGVLVDPGAVITNLDDERSKSKTSDSEAA